jgi:hypothetical protein
MWSTSPSILFMSSHCSAIFFLEVLPLVGRTSWHHSALYSICFKSRTLYQLSWLWKLLVFMFPFKQVSVWRIKSCHDRFFVLCFQLCTNSTHHGCYSKPIILGIWRVVSWNINNTSDFKSRWLLYVPTVPHLAIVHFAHRMYLRFMYGSRGQLAITNLYNFVRYELNL